MVVVGPSGCGKTTLLKMLAGLLPPTEGEIRVEGNVITRPHRDVGVVFQSPLLLPWRRVLGNVLMPVEVKGLPPDTYRQRALDLLSNGRARRFRRESIRGNCPAACSSACRSAARWCTTRRSC